MYTTEVGSVDFISALITFRRAYNGMEKETTAVGGSTGVVVATVSMQGVVFVWWMRVARRRVS